MCGNVNFHRSFKDFRFLIDIVVKPFCLVNKDFKIDEIILKSNLRCENSLFGNVSFALNNLTYDSIFFSKINCQMIGNTENHHIKILISEDLFLITMNICGSIDCIYKNWKGSVLNVDFLKNHVNNNHINKKMMKLYNNFPSQFIFSIDHLYKNTIFQFSCDIFLKNR